MPVVKESSQFIYSSFLQAPDHPTALTAIDKIFSLNYAYLRPFYVPAWSIFGLLKQRSLIDREGLQIEVESFLQETDRGILFLEGKAGTGKTTFLARWVAERGAIHQFFEMIPKQKSLLIAKANLAAQLIRIFELADFMPGDQFEKEINSPDLIKNLLEEGSKQRNLINQDQKIWIVIDGLDNIEISQDTGILGLPETLPKNVYMILSKSPDQKSFSSIIFSKVVSIDHAPALYHSDMRKYCQKVLENSFSGTIDKQNKVDQVREILLEKARGNWIHLNHLLRLLDDPENSHLSIEELWGHLPDDLFHSYLHILIKLKDEDHVNWYRYLLPVLGVLAAAPEPITLPRLALEAGIQADFSQLKNHIEHSLSPLLSVDDQERYQFNHLSLKELLSGNFQHGNLSPREEAFFQELVENSRLIHLHLAKDILSSWGGLQAGLPALKDSVKLTAREEYGLDYLFTHLEKAGLTDDLRKLINLQWQINESKRLKTLSITLPSKKKIKKDELADKSQYVNAWYVAKRSHNRLAGYREDLQKTWTITSGIGDQVRLALMRCSIETISSKSDEGSILDGEEQDQLIGHLASCLAESGEIDEAFAAVEMIHSDHWKSQALARIAGYMPSNSVPTILRISQSINDPRGKTQIISNCALHLTDLSKPVQALEIAGQVPNLLQRNITLSQLSIRLMENNQSELALEAIYKISDESMQVDFIVSFARQLNRDDLQVALTMVQGFKDDDNKVEALNGLAPFLPIPLQRDCFQWIQQIDESTRSRVLVVLLPHIHESLLKDGLTSTREIKDENLRAPVLVELIIRTAATGNPGKAFKLVPAILGENHIAAAIVGIGPYLTEEQRLEAYVMGSKIKEEFYLGRVLEGLIPFLSEPEIAQILEKVSLYKNNAAKASVLTAIIKRYHVLGQQVRTLEIIQNCPSHDIQARLFVEMAPLWSEELKKSAVAAALELESDEAKAIALLGLLPYLQKSDLIKIKAVAVELPDQGWSNINRRSEILISIGLLLVTQGEIETALLILDELQDDESLAGGIRELIMVLSNGPLIKAFGEMRRIQNPKIRINLIGEIAPRLPAFLIDKFLKSLKNEEEWVRLEAVNRLAPHVPVECLQSYMSLLLEIHDQNIRSQSLTALVKKWLVLPVPESLNLWRETIQSLSNQPRPDFLVDLAKLTPVIIDLGGVVAIKETLQAVKDVATWWN